MISEQRIIELAKFHANEVYQDYAGFTFKQLQDFANALQAEWLNSLGEPKGYLHLLNIVEGSVKQEPLVNVSKCQFHPYGIAGEDYDKDFYVTSTKLYALPNEEKPE